MRSKLPKVVAPEVFIAMPMAKTQMLHVETAGYCAMMNQLPQIKWGHVNSISPEFSRNSLIEHHFHNDPTWTHMFFLDTDVVPPKDCMRILLSADADVITGMYPLFIQGKVCWAAQEAGTTDWLLLSDELPNEPYKITAAGGGCLLVRKEVLVDVGYPWFENHYQEIFKNDGNGLRNGEDVDFCMKVVEKGYDIYAEPSVICKHYNQVDMTEFYGACESQLT